MRVPFGYTTKIPPQYIIPKQRFLFIIAEAEVLANATGLQAQKYNQKMQQTADAMEKINHSYRV